MKENFIYFTCPIFIENGNTKYINKKFCIYELKKINNFVKNVCKFFNLNYKFYIKEKTLEKNVILKYVNNNIFFNSLFHDLIMKNYKIILLQQIVLFYPLIKNKFILELCERNEFGFWFKKYYIRINFNSKLKKSDKCILDNLIVYKYKNKKFVKFSKKELKKIKKFIKKICKLIYKNSKFNIQIKQEYSNNLMTIDKINESISATSFDNYTCDYILFLNPLYHNLIMENYEKILIHQILHLIFLKKIKKGCKKDFINSKILFGACGEEFNLYMKKNHIFCKLNFWIS